MVHKILNTFDMRDCLHTFIVWSKKNKLLEVEGGGGARAPNAT